MDGLGWDYTAIPELLAVASETGSINAMSGPHASCSEMVQILYITMLFMRYWEEIPKRRWYPVFRGK